MAIPRGFPFFWHTHIRFAGSLCVYTCIRNDIPTKQLTWSQFYGCTVISSSTAQGGGGSFKNRKPIGEVGCCESRMAELIHWWTERWLKLKLCFLEWLQWLQWSPHPQLLDVLWCSAVVVLVVVWCSGVVVVICNKCSVVATRNDIWTSKSAPNPSVFNTFGFEMCFASQPSALFRHLNFQKCFERGVLCTFWLGHVLCVTTAYTFSTSQLPKALRPWCALYILTWKCASRHNSVPTLRCLHVLTWKGASRHNGVQFFISHLATWLRTRRFSEPTFQATNHWKDTVFRDFATFSRACLFFLLTLSLLWSSLFCSSLLWLFPPLLFHLSILSEVWLLNFLRPPLSHHYPNKWK